MSLQIIITAFSLATDAFAVSIGNGICSKPDRLLRTALQCALTFGFFQGLMPLIGFLIGGFFKSVAESIDHWIALVLLVIIGGKMILDAYWEMKHPEQECPAGQLDFKTLVLQGIATSIDALAVGIGFAVVDINLPATCIAIAVVTALCCFCGVMLGHRFGRLFSDKAQFIGGGMLILIGINIFLDHMIV